MTIPFHGRELDAARTVKNDPDQTSGGTSRLNEPRKRDRSHEVGDSLSHRQLADAVDGVEDRLVLFDREDRLLLGNKSWWDQQKGFGLNPRIGERYRDYARNLAASGYIQDAVGNEVEWVKRRLKKRSELGEANQVKMSDGDVMLVRDHRLPDGGILTITTAITKRVRAEVALAESEQRFRNIAENSLQGLMVHRDDKPLFVNAAFAQILGYDHPDKVMSLRNFDEYIAPQERLRLRHYRESRIRGEPAPNRYEYLAIRRDGKEVWLEMLNERVNWDGEPAIQSIIYDVTERKNAEAAARKSIERYRNLLEESVQAVMIRQEDKIAFTNQACADLFGYSGPEEVLALDSTDELAAAHEWGRLRSYGKARENDLEVPTVYEFQGRKKDGSILWLENRAQLVEWEDSPAILAMLTDISARKHAEDNLLHAKEGAEAANRTKSEFLSSMSHELRTPLNAVLGFGQLLASDTTNPLHPSHREAVDMILAGGQHLLSLIGDMIDLTRIESGKLTLHLERSNIEDVVNEALLLVGNLGDENNVSIRFDGSDTNPPQVLADRRRLRQILLNLISNAIKYNKPGGTVNVAYQDAGNGRLRISIADTGRGIGKSDHTRLFEPFERLGIETSKIEGTGVGLTISKQLTELMDGTIDFTSVEGEGSTFFIELPIATVSLEKSGSSDFGGAGEGVATGAAGLERRTRKVLYVEDNPANIMLMEAFLKKIPETMLLKAETAERGVELAGLELPDIILMDLGLPDMSGLEAQKRLRSIERTRAIPVVAVTADATPKTAVRCRAAGFDGVATKPLDLQQLTSIIANLTGT
jgi:PAS domain S-box-containing protein